MPGSAIFLRSFGRLGPTAPVLRTAGTGPLLPTSDSVHPGSAALLRSFGCLGFTMPALDFLHPGLLPTSQSPVRLESILFIFGQANFELSSFSLEYALIESATSTQSCARIAPVPLVSDLAHLGPLLPPQHFSCPGIMLPPFGQANLGSSLAVLDFTALGSLLLLRSLSRVEAALFAMDFLHLGLGSLNTKSCETGPSDFPLLPDPA